MLKTHYVKDLSEELDGKEVKLAGWVHEIRIISKIIFVLLRDSTGIAQLIALKNETDENLFKRISQLSIESAIFVEGTVTESSQSKKRYEVKIKDLCVLSKAETPPITVQEKGITIALDKRLDNRTIDLRKPKNNAIFHIQSAIIEGMTHILNKKGFLQVFTPAIMGSTSEGGAEVFKFKYFDKDAFLRQDPQLHRQLTILGGIEKLYDLGPSWRAEMSHTTRHLCEHRTLAVEMAFIKDETDTIKLEEDLIIGALKNVNDKCETELKTLGVKIKIPESPFPELRFPKIYDIVEQEGGKLSYGSDLDADTMKIIWEYVHKKFHSDFYFFNRFPSAVKPFYVMKVDDEPEWARSVDLNFRGLELSSGGQREHRYEKIVEQAKEKGMSLKNIAWFTEPFRYGSPPHGGFAIGIERITKELLKLENIREAVLFPRAPERLEP
ncbi:MAG: aspartate--tRNA(Asn) ligase [Candidatus Woesearchaeota archaeon]